MLQLDRILNLFKPENHQIGPEITRIAVDIRLSDKKVLQMIATELEEALGIRIQILNDFTPLPFKTNLLIFSLKLSPFLSDQDVIGLYHVLRKMSSDFS